MLSAGDVATISSGPAPAAPRATPGEVHVWLASLTATPGARRALWEILDENERARALAFRFPVHRQRFVAARGTLRLILGRYLGHAPARLRLGADPNGKPVLASGALDLQFNVSHSEDLAIFAVAQGRQVGVDVERVRGDLDIEAIARRTFSALEVDALWSLPRPSRTSAFFACWTLKEAYLKARGDGLAVPLDAFAVSIGAGGPARLLEVRGAPEDPRRWSLRTLAVDGPYQAAVAVEGHDWHLRQWRWTG
ncbi:MAG: 4'-phosphopantetheinyl transferase family protein [Candidatus Rokuibacteriota bacterium]